ncbi:hypothetical protein TREMEDRAFT_45020 [Tremella mesenterica DSM 1558]|uniref:uncharacterized protein n=1 Tax=Tremella mesenterica (strain ATCC 24925 / CBS 8224 / DSM 1558 / NBRC 9311 / NRRL Y-6157 / RJB 2259-6 / UBC 559-6) TaxID=578456 RepID=UPI0003F49A79|nr:uncharacterized protein TREMEDRAFT_45020 [Tremella mesenterica DSM 1558]EIW68066.1 hypothetical protein TREMEDRAFT_45020 [Tremella mesenterica DSM 1558]
MDVILELCDQHIFDSLYSHFLPNPSIPLSLSHLNTTSLPSSYSSSTTYHPCLQTESKWPRDDITRQTISIFLIAMFGAYVLYFLFSYISYQLLFDKRLRHHPKFLKDQEWLEIKSSLIAVPTIDVLTLPWFLGEVRGKSMLYEKVEDYGWMYLCSSVILYLVFTDFLIYWIHRLEHHPRVYKYIHKPHHKWIVPTPWAALAFHPLDGYAQSLPYHIFVFLFPMQKYVYLTLFVLVQLWTIIIHDADMITGSWWEKWLNSPAHHTLHHLYFTCNYGQYFVWADEYFDSHRAPEQSLDPIHESLRMMKKKGLIDEDGNEIPQNDKKGQ